MISCDERLMSSSDVKAITWGPKGYCFVSTVLIFEGVSSTVKYGDVFYSGEELEKSCWAWIGKPITVNHPYSGNTANDETVYEKQRVGMIVSAVYDAEIKGIRCLVMVDVEEAINKWPKLLEHIENKECVSFAIGAHTELVEDVGVYEGRAYTGRIVNIKPDHAAILTEYDV